MVPEHQERDRDRIRAGGPQCRDGVLRRALAQNAHDRPVGNGELNSERGRHAVSEPVAGGEEV